MQREKMLITNKMRHRTTTNSAVYDKKSLIAYYNQASMLFKVIMDFNQSLRQDSAMHSRNHPDEG